jgi:hypothetical protein
MPVCLSLFLIFLIIFRPYVFNAILYCETRQKLTCGFANYHSVIIRNIQKLIKEPSQIIAILYLNPNDRTARVDFVQNMEYKFLELLSLDFKECPTEVMHKMANFRYQNMKKRNAYLDNKLIEVSNFIRLKNPSMLGQ